MTDVLGTLRNAGYSDQEITDYMTTQRQTLRKGGYADDEIDAYFGIPRTPQAIPGALIQRAVAGTEAVNTLNSLPDQSSGVTGWLQQMWQRGQPRSALEKGVAETEQDALSSAFEVAKAAGRGFAIGAGDKPLGSWTGPPDWNAPGWKKMAQAGLTIVGAPLEGVVRLGGGVAGALTGGVMEANKRIFGADYDPSDVGGFLNDYLPGLIGVHTELMRLDRDHTGTPEMTRVGGLPNGQDLQNASRVIGGGETTPLQEKKLTGIYAQQGLHPAEVAREAQTDSTIAQSILSSDPGDMPYGYQFHGYEALPEATAKAEATAEEQRALGLQGAIREPYFQDPIKKGRSFKTDSPLLITEPDEVPDYGMPVADGFELKEAAEKANLREQLLLEGKDVDYSDAEKQILSKISVDGKAPERPLTWNRVYTNLIDKLYPI